MTHQKGQSQEHAEALEVQEEQLENVTGAGFFDCCIKPKVQGSQQGSQTDSRLHQYLDNLVRPPSPTGKSGDLYPPKPLSSGSPSPDRGSIISHGR